MESIHGVLEWFIIVFVVLAGFAVNRWNFALKARYAFYAVLLLTAFIFDLNKISFRSDVLNFIYYFLILLSLADIIWICVRKKSRLLICGAFSALVPVFLYVFVAVLAVAPFPFPCHNGSTEFIDAYKSCNGKVYTLKKRLSFDPFRPTRIYILYRNINNAPLKKQVDRFSAPNGYIEAQFATQWECGERGRGKANLLIDGYILWTLEDKN